MHKFVIDSSVIIKWLNKEDEKYLEQAAKVLEDVRDGFVTLLAPELAKYEIGNALLLGKKLFTDQAEIAIATFFVLPIRFVLQTEQSAVETYRIAQKMRITYYDASFMALAHQEKAILITDNPKHQGRNEKVKVIPLSQYRMEE